MGGKQIRARHARTLAFYAALLAGCPPALVAQVTANSVITKLPTAKWTFGADGFAATNAPISQLSSLATDLNGNIIFADPGNHVVLRLNSDGTVTVLAGNGLEGFSGDNGPAVAASLDRPSDAVLDQNGNLYIYDEFNFRIRRVTPDGTIATIAGTGVNSEAGNGGPALRATVGGADVLGDRLAVDSANNLYISNRCQIRRIDASGMITVFAGSSKCGHGPDGPALQTDMNPYGMAFDSQGNLYFTEPAARYIRKIGTDGNVTTLLGDGGKTVLTDGRPVLNFPHSVVIDSAGSLIYSDVNNEVIVKVGGDGSVAIVTGNTQGGYTGDGGPAAQGTVSFPHGLALDKAGNLYIADSGNFRIRRIRAGNIETVAGNGQFRSVPDGTPAAQAYLYGPDNMAFDQSGNLLISEVSMDEVTEILSTDSTFHVLAGNGVAGNGGGPLATASLIDHPRQMAVDAQGAIYFADNTNSVVYKRTPGDGKLTKFAGTVFAYSYTGDGGPAVSATLNAPWGIAVDGSGTVFIADTGNNVIRRVGIDGTITTYAGTGTAGFSGDNGPATAAQLSTPRSLAIDPQGNLLICDRANNRIRKVDPSGTITTIAGDGRAASSGDGGPASQASVDGPYAMALDTDGGIFLLTSTGARLRRIDTQGNISTIAGDGVTLSNQGDGGPAGKASLEVSGMAVDSLGNVFLSDFNGDGIRVILNFEPNLYLASPAFSEFPDAKVALLAVSGGDPTPPHSFSVGGGVGGVLFRGTADQPWLVVENPQGTTPGTMTFHADPSKLSPGEYLGNVTLARVGSTQPFAKVTVALTVVQQLPPSLSVEPPLISLATAVGAPNQPSRTLRILNTGSGQLDFKISISGAAQSLQVAPLSGTVAAGSPQDVVIGVNPANLSAGTFTALLAIASSATGQTVNVPVAISVAARPQRMLLSQKGIMFNAVTGGGVTPAQSFFVLDEGGGTFDWTARPVSVGGGPNWFSISPQAGTSAASGVPPSISIKADPSVVSKPGVYYGLVRVTSQNAANAPQDVEVVLNYLGSGVSTPASVSRAGLIFVAPAGTSSPSSQTITVTNLNATPLGISPQALTYEGIPWLTVVPNAAQQQLAPGATLRLTVAAKVDTLTVGVHQGTVLLQFPSPLPNVEVNVRFIVTPANVTGSANVTRAPRGVAEPMDVTRSGCAPTLLVPLFSSLFNNFSTPAAWPQPLESLVIDDCGAPLMSGRVVASFSNGEPPVSLVSLGDGRWQGTWFGRNSGSSLQVTLAADSSDGTLHGSQTYDGSIQANGAVPAIDSGGVQGPASNGQQASIGPGSIISISGANFAAAATATSQWPLTNDLLGSEAVIAGVNLPLIYAGANLIQAVVPYDMQPGQYLAVVTRGNTISGPETIVVGAAQPNVLRVTTSTDSQVPQSVWSQFVTGKRIDPSTIPPANALAAGNTLQIYCTGLGAVMPTLDPSQQAPAPAPAVQNPVTLMLGNTPATVTSANLVPGLAGIYLVQAAIPSGISTGDGIPLVVSVQGQSSPPVNISIH
jgi:uncharacterized protein (TIGR03437 family)